MAESACHARAVRGAGVEAPMKTFDAPDRTDRGDPQAPPRFELEYLVDDFECPTEVMVVPAAGGDRSDTEWITADIHHAVPIEWVR